MRLMLDTCAIIDLLTDMETLGKGAQALIEDPENMLFASCESMRELVVHFNNKKLLNRDPSDHVIIAQAITERLPLLSSDTRFWFYRNQGLELIEY